MPASMNEFRARRAFYLLVAVLWLLTLLVAGELYQVLRWRAITQKNPYVLSREGEVRWRVRFGDDEPIEPGPMPQPALPPPPPLEEKEWRAALFARLDQEDRTTFGNVFSLDAYVLGADDTVVARYPIPLEQPSPALDDCAGEDAARLRQVLEAGRKRTAPTMERVRERSMEEDGLDLFAFPLGAVDGHWCVWRETVPRLVPDTLWDRPYLTYRKHEHMQSKYFFVWTNNLGYRDHDVPVPKPPDSYRILCVGASTTEEGPTNDITWPNLLEARLDGAMPGKRIEVVNCGIPGLNASKEHMLVGAYLAMEPDLIVFYNGVNDLCHYHFPRWVERAAFWQRQVRKSAFLNRALNRFLLPGRAQMAADLRETVFRDFRKIHALLSEAGVPADFCSFAYPDIGNLTSGERDYYEHDNALYWGGRYVTFASYCRGMALFNSELRRFCAETGAGYVPVAEHLRGGTRYFGDVCHMRDEGIARKAEIVADYLLNRWKTKEAAQPG